MEKSTVPPLLSEAISSAFEEAYKKGYEEGFAEAKARPWKGNFDPHRLKPEQILRRKGLSWGIKLRDSDIDSGLDYVFLVDGKWVNPRQAIPIYLGHLTSNDWVIEDQEK